MRRSTLEKPGAGTAATVIRKNTVLQKAHAQLRGERVQSKPSRKNDDEEDIGAYLSSLSRKKTKEPQWDKFGELSDISLASDDNDIKPAPSLSSKFFKKKTSPAEKSDNDQVGMAGSKFMKEPKISEGLQNRAATGQLGLGSKSSALNKAAASVAKFSFKPKKELITLSDSDLDMDLSMDSDIMADVQAMKQASKPTTRPTESKRAGYSNRVPQSKTEPSRNATITNQMDTQSSTHEGLNLMKSTRSKSPHGNYEMSDSSASDAIGKGGSRFMKKKVQSEKPPSPDVLSSPDVPMRQSLFKLKSSEKHATKVTLDTDEESLADFIGGLSSSTEPGSAHTPTPKSPSSARRATSSFLKPKLSPVSRPSPEPGIETIREEEEASDLDTSIEEDSFKVNIMDLDALEPVADPEPISTKPHSRSTKVERQKSPQKMPHSPKEAKKRNKYEKRSKNERKQKKETGKENAGYFASFGLHSVDELLGLDDEVSAVSEVVSQVEQVPSHQSPTPLRSILSPTPRSQTPRRVRLTLSDVHEVRSRSPSPEPISTARAINSEIYTDDFTEIYTEGKRSQTPMSVHSSDSEESIKTMTESDRSSPARFRRSSLSRQKSEDHYSDDFTETHSYSRRRRTYSGRSSSHDSAPYSEDYTSYSETGTDRSKTPSPSSTPRSVRSPRSPRERSRKETKSIHIQTTEVPGLWYHWNLDQAGMAGVSPSFGLGMVDPSPIATHVVSADALEAITAYSPSVIALNDMLRQQLQLTQEFIDSQRRMHRSYVGVMIPDHKYTTLEDTKQYIAKHRKPKLTFDEALRQVREEMGIN